MADDPPGGPDWSGEDFGHRPGLRPESWPPEPVVGSPRPWGPWATIAWTVLTIGVMLVAQAAVLASFVVARLAADPKVNLAALGADLATDGTILGVATLASTPLVVALVMLLAYVRLPIADYLALRSVRLSRLALSVLGLVLFLSASDGLTLALGRPLVSPFSAEVYRTAWLPPLLLAYMVAAPLGEEVLFRGFFYRGIADSRWGPGLAIGFSSILWALMHVQYDLYGIATIYLMGLYLGYVRHRTGSLLVTIHLHALANLVATAEAAMIVGRGV